MPSFKKRKGKKKANHHQELAELGVVDTFLAQLRGELVSKRVHTKSAESATAVAELGEKEGQK